jgi:hypothetical protein
VGVGVELAVGPEVEQLARSIIGTGRKGVAIGEESAESADVAGMLFDASLDSVNI